MELKSQSLYLVLRRFVFIFLFCTQSMKQKQGLMIYQLHAKMMLFHPPFFKLCVEHFICVNQEFVKKGKIKAVFTPHP